MVSMQLNMSVKGLLYDAELPSEDLQINPIDGGGNNKAYLVQTKSEKYLAKVYYSHPDDLRDRLGNEFSFLTYAWNIGLRCIPKPILSSVENNIGLYEFLEGRKLTPSELSQQHILKSAYFIRDLNQWQERDKSLPSASESCFSIEEHLLMIDYRFKKLESIQLDLDVDRQAHVFIGDLKKKWCEIKASIRSKAKPISEELNLEDRCISPSDFGFHNALVTDNDSLNFIDFEYAGWDDPAKMVGDFFTQPEVPVSLKYFDEFISEAMNYSKNKELLIERTHLLFPIFRIKWCCILLNEFLPSSARRRQFAKSDFNPELSKKLQLKKAQQIFETKVI